MPCAYAQGIYKQATPLRFLQYNYGVRGEALLQFFFNVGSSVFAY